MREHQWQAILRDSGANSPKREGRTFEMAHASAMQRLRDALKRRRIPPSSGRLIVQEQVKPARWRPWRGGKGRRDTSHPMSSFPWPRAGLIDALGLQILTSSIRAAKDMTGSVSRSTSRRSSSVIGISRSVGRYSVPTMLDRRPIDTRNDGRGAHFQSGSGIECHAVRESLGIKFARDDFD